MQRSSGWIGIAVFLCGVAWVLSGCERSGVMVGGNDDDGGDDDAGDDDAGDDDGGDDDGDNQPPTAPAVAIDPAAPEGADDLTCTITEPATDPDGDALTYAYAWTVDGTGTNQSAELLSGDYTEAGEQWACEVRAHDGTAEGPPGTAAVTIDQNEFLQEQALAGVPATDECPECDFTFDVTYTTTLVEGSCSVLCDYLFADGVYTLGFSSTQGMVMIYWTGYGWNGWYYASLTDDRVDFHWYGKGYTQQGYWVLDGENMTGMAFNSEP